MRRASSILFLAVLVAGCGIDSGSTTTGPSTTTLPGPTTTVAPTTSLPATTVVPPTTTLPVSTTSTIPGEPVDFGPRAGDVLMVTGVRYDDVLNLRAAPGATQPILDTISPTEMDLYALGETRTVAGAFWIKVRYEGTDGWVHMGYVGYAGGVEDGTAEVVAELGTLPEAATLVALGQQVAAVYTSDEVQSRVVQVTAGSAGDLYEIMFDVIGFADDSVGGARLHIFAEKTGSGYRLKSVEVMAICIRGVDDGICV